MALVHRCRFVEWVPEQILCLSTNSNNLLAVGRINGDIEIWNPAKATLYSGKKITGQSGQSLRCITWGKGEGSQRLFSGTDLGYIHEWNLLTLTQEASTDSFGGWVTSMSVNGSGTRLAAGTHDGVTIFDISEKNLSYKLHNSILTTAVYFHPTENIYTGSGNLIRIYQPNGPKFVETGTIKLDAKVASLLVLPDYTVVVGTTKGGVQMWNGKTKVRVATFNEHQSSVVALASTPSGDSVFASGEDPKICMFRQHEDNKWVYTNHQRRHTHEVSSLVVLKNRVISGSTDTMLIFYEQAAFLANVGFHGIHKIFPYPHSPLLSFSPSSRFVLFRKNDGLELWRLGSAAVESSGRIGEMVIPVASTPVKLLDMELKKDRHYLRTSAISPKGKYIACASINSVKLFAVEYSEDTVTVEPIDLPYEILNPHRLALTDKHLILVNQESLQVLDLASREILFEKELAGDEGEDYKHAPINTIATSVDGAYVAVGDLNNNIHVFDLNKKMNICTLPKLPRQHTALGLQPKTSAIAVVDITGHFVMYDYLKKAFTPWSSQLDSTLPATFALCTKTDTVVGISFDSNSPSTMLLWSSRFIAAVKIEDDVSGPATKRSKSNAGKPIPTDTNSSSSSSPSSSSSSSSSTPKLTLNVIGKYSDIMGVEFVDNGKKSELVVVERPWLEIIPHLPNVFDLKLFGR